MASEVVDVGARYPALTKPAPGVFRIGYIGTSAETKTTDKLSAVLRKYASFTENAARIDSVEIIALDSIPVRMNDPPPATEKKEDDEDEDAGSSTKFVAEFWIMPKYATPFQATTDQQRKETKAWNALETKTKKEFVRRFAEQYLTNSNRNFHLWLVDTNEAVATMDPPGVYFSSFDTVQEITRVMLKQETLKMLMVTADDTEAVRLTRTMPADGDSLFKLPYGGLQSNFADDGWWNREVRYSADLKDVNGLLRWQPTFGKGIPMVLRAMGSKEHIIATLDWMFSLHKGSVTNAIAKGTNKQLPQTLEDLIADYSMMSGKHCSSTKPQRKKWLLPS